MIDLGTERNRLFRQSFATSANDNFSSEYVDLDIVLSEKRVRIDAEGSSPNIEDGLSSAPKMCSIFEDENATSESSKVSSDEFRSDFRRVSSGLADNNNTNISDGRMKRGGSSGILLFTDSLELLPLSSAPIRF